MENRKEGFCWTHPDRPVHKHSATECSECYEASIERLAVRAFGGGGLKYRRPGNNDA